MPTSADETILARLKTVFAGINATSNYTYDLSATDAVQIGHMPIALQPDPPCAFLWYMGERNEHGEPIGWYRTLTQWGFAMAVPYAADTVESRVNACLRAKSDIVRAVEADRRLNQNVYDLRLARVDDVTDDAIEFPPGVAIIAGIIETWRERAPGEP